MTDRHDVIVIGAGIVGLATARALRATGAGVFVVEKEPVVGAHQSSHNSGVIHSGVYYRPGSEKARLCVEGRLLLEGFCDDRGIPRRRDGKVIVARSVDELERLQELARRGRAQGLDVRVVGPQGLAELEPHATGLAALHVPETGVVDFAAVTAALADELVDDGGELLVGAEVTAVTTSGDGVTIATTRGDVHGAVVVNCAGLQSDRVARLAGEEPDIRIVPFRGEYHELVPAKEHLVRSLVYPVPDPRFPFLGVHLTRGIDGRVHVGPNALLALAREGAHRASVDRADLRALALDPALWRLGRRYGRTGAAEVARAASRRLLVRELRRMIPAIGPGDLAPAGSGVRAQAVDGAGRLLDDFAIIERERAVHVLNAPSPAATASLAIGRSIAAIVTRRAC
jgi:(S)-2-hydroxyglutarate dehydrogenase